MHTSEKKIELFRYIDNLEASELNYIYHILISNRTEKETDFWDNLNEWQKNDIELGLADLRNGKKKKFDDFMLKY